MALKLGHKGWFAFIISILLLTDLATLLNIPFLRRTIGFFFLAFLPGLLIIRILKLNKVGFAEKFVLSVGLSTSFLMFFGFAMIMGSAFVLNQLRDIESDKKNNKSKIINH